MIMLEWHEFASSHDGCVLVRGVVECSPASLYDHLRKLLHKALAGEVLCIADENRTYCRLRLSDGKLSLEPADATLMDRFDRRLELVAYAWGRLMALQADFQDLGFRDLDLSLSARALLATRNSWSSFYADDIHDDS